MWKLDTQEVKFRSSRSSRVVVSIVATLLVITSILALTTLYMKPVELINVDPAIFQLLATQRCVVVFAYVKPEVPTSQLDIQILKEWKFTSFTLILANVCSVDDVLSLAKKSLYVGIIRRVVLPPIPTPYKIPKSDIENAKKINYLINIHNPTLRYSGRGVTIAIVDSGIEYWSKWFSKTCRDWDTENTRIKAMISFVVRKSNGEPITWIRGVNMTFRELYDWEVKVYNILGVFPFLDVVGHGTSVSFVVGGSECISGVRGVAPSVEYVVIKVFPDSFYASLENIIDALYWIYMHHNEYNIKIVVLSLGALMTSSSLYSNPLNVVICELVNKGILVVVASGNEGAMIGTLTTPASSPCAISVGALNPVTLRIAPFTSLPPTTYKQKLDFLAVGYLVWTYLPPYTAMAQYIENHVPQLVVDEENNIYMVLGTSYSAPACAGVLATWVEKYHNVLLNFEKIAKENSIPLHNTVVKFGIPIAPK